MRTFRDSIWNTIGLAKQLLTSYFINIIGKNVFQELQQFLWKLTFFLYMAGDTEQLYNMYFRWQFSLQNL